MRGKHQWDFMGFDTESGNEYAYCDLCKKYKSINKDNTFKIISKSFYEKRVKEGKVNIEGKPKEEEK